jgi:hypothetical protein
MRNRIAAIGALVASMTVSMAAQTNVTNSNNGTTNTVPVYAGSAALGNSPIAISGSSVGIGTTSPASGSSLDVYGGGNITTRYSDGGSGIALGSLGTSQPFVGFRVSDQSQRLQIGLLSVNTTTERLAFSGDCGGGCGMTERFSILSTGNVGIGTTSPGAKLEVNGGVKLTANSGASITFQDGTVQSTAYTGVTCGGDYAESMDVAGDRTKYGPGDILVLDTDHPGKVLKSVEAYSTAVAGIYSTRPGTIGRRQLTPKSEAEVPMAMVGVVPTKVTAENGAIKVGDLLVSSSRPGYAMKGTDRSRMLGAVLGKAIGPLESGTGVIEVLVTLQ